MNKEVTALITAYTKKFDTGDQRAELLSRNAQFLKDLADFMDSFSIKEILPYRRHFQEERGEHRVNITKITKEGLESPAHRFRWPGALGKVHKLKEIVEKNLGIWTLFCRRWSVMPEWDGDLRTLDEYMEPPIELIWIEGSEDFSPALIMRVNEWTTLNDVKKAWGQVEELQNQLWRKQEKRTNFARDLLWYDLYKKHGLKVREIAKLWEEYHPEDIDLLVTRRMKKKINKEDLRGKALTDIELSQEIKNGFLAEKYSANFETERSDYVSCGDEGRKVTPPLQDAVKKAIKRMSLQINQVSTSLQKSALRLDILLSTGRQINQR